MNVSGENSKEIFELFINKLVFSELKILTRVSSLDAPLERNASLRIIMKVFVVHMNYFVG